MQCPQCKTETQAEAAFCHRCGTRLIAPESPPDTSASPPPADATGSQRLQAAVDARRLSDETESDRWLGSFSPKAMYPSWIACAVITVLLLVGGGLLQAKTEWWHGWWWLALLVLIAVLWLYHALVYAVRRLGIRYRLTTQRFFHERGILRRVTDRIDLVDIQDVSCEQGLLERMFGTGTIRIRSRDQSHPELTLLGIESPSGVASTIDEVRRREEMRRGVLIEQ